jgi:hypothetical protein
MTMFKNYKIKNSFYEIISKIEFFGFGAYLFFCNPH